MAEKKISELAAVAAAVDGTEVVALVQSAVTYKGTLRDVAKLGYQVVAAVGASSKTLGVADRGVWNRHAVACALLVPTNASVAFAIGELFNGVQSGAGQVTITGDTGVTVNRPAGLNAKTRAQGSSFCLIKVATNEWDLIGDLEVTA